MQTHILNNGSTLKEYPGISNVKNNAMNLNGEDADLNWKVENDIKEMRFKKMKNGRKDFTNMRNPCNGYC